MSFTLNLSSTHISTKSIEIIPDWQCGNGYCWLINWNVYSIQVHDTTSRSWHYLGDGTWHIVLLFQPKLTVKISWRRVSLWDVQQITSSKYQRKEKETPHSFENTMFYMKSVFSISGDNYKNVIIFLKIINETNQITLMIF